MISSLHMYFGDYTFNYITGLVTPVVTLVVKGDEFTLKRVKEATSKENKMPGQVVIVNGSGGIADILADIYNTLKKTAPRQDIRLFWGLLCSTF